MSNWHAFHIALVLATASVFPAASQEFETDAGKIRVVTVASELEHPWGLAFLPDGRMLVTERSGRLRIVAKDGSLSKPLLGVPTVYAHKEGGLLDVILDPDFAQNHTIYLSYAEPGEGGGSTAVMRARLNDDGLTELEVIFRQTPKADSNAHFGSRLVFAPEGSLFVTLGDRLSRDGAQDLAVHLGKVVRINADGSIPADNPYRGRAGIQPEIWSYGHRNIQGATIHPTTGKLWIHEHGPMGGDEINIPEPGKNYGWPLVSYGLNYDGSPVGTGKQTGEGIEEPIYYWDPSIAPSGMVFYTGNAFPVWQGNLFVGSLKFRLLVRLELQEARILTEERLLSGLHERIRDVRQGPDGLLYLLTDSPTGRILRLEPVVL